MQGVLLGLAPQARWVNLTHGIPAQNLTVATIELRAAWRYLPKGSLHLAVVDPGVGSGRRILCGERDGRLLLGPDNGLLPGVLGESAILYELDPEPWQLAGISATFHGRDVFVPVAAALLQGELRPTESMRCPDAILPPPSDRAAEDGCGVLMADHFGNLICDWEPAHRGPIPAGVKILVEDREIPLVKTYSDVPHGEYLALINSWGFLEIARRDGHAAHGLDLQAGDSIQLERQSS